MGTEETENKVSTTVLPTNKSATEGEEAKLVTVQAQAGLIETTEHGTAGVEGGMDPEERPTRSRQLLEDLG